MCSCWYLQQKADIERNCWMIWFLGLFLTSINECKITSERYMEKWFRLGCNHQSITNRLLKKRPKDLQLTYNVNLQIFTGNDQYQFLCFSYAAEKVFGPTIYLRCIKENQVSTNLIYSKSIITPSKELSLPRIELLTVLFGARSLNFWKKVFSWKIKEMIFWTDSRFLLKKYPILFYTGKSCWN